MTFASMSIAQYNVFVVRSEIIFEMRSQHLCMPLSRRERNFCVCFFIFYSHVKQKRQRRRRQWTWLTFMLHPFHICLFIIRSKSSSIYWSVFTNDERDDLNSSVWLSFRLISLWLIFTFFEWKHNQRRSAATGCRFVVVDDSPIYCWLANWVRNVILCIQDSTDR